MEVSVSSASPAAMRAMMSALAGAMTNASAQAASAMWLMEAGTVELLVTSPWMAAAVTFGNMAVRVCVCVSEAKVSGVTNCSAATVSITRTL